MRVKFSVTAKCTAATGETIEPGEYFGRRVERRSVSSPQGKADDLFVLELPLFPFEIDVSSLVKSRAITVR